MDLLPIELYQSIFEYLNINQLFELRLVNKRLDKIVKEYRIKELIFEDNYKFRYNWCFSRRPINYLNVVGKSKQFIIKTSLFNIKYLRFLKICLSGPKFCRLKLSHINTLVYLTHLDIDARCYNSTDCLLELPRLQVLSLSISDGALEADLILDLPKLELLNLNCSLFGVVFKHPQTIKKLKVQEYEPRLSAFRNVEHFECFYLSNSELESKNLDLFFIFPKLKKLLIECDTHLVLDRIIREKERLKKNDLRIYYRSLECMSLNDLKTYKSKDYYLTFNILEQHFNRYQRLADDLDFVNEMDFNKFTKWFTAIPIDFFDKYTNINKLFVRACVDQEFFISFIAKCANLGFLSISESLFDQAFYDRLPGISMLRELYIEQLCDGVCESNLDISFVWRMKSLRIFNTNLELSIEEIKKLGSSQAGFLTEFALSANHNLVHIQKMGKDKYCLKNNNGLQLFNKVLGTDALITWLTYLKKKETTITRSAFKKMKKV